MPEVAERLDRRRFDEIRHKAMLGANLWLRLAIAGEAGDRTDAWRACQNIQELTKQVFKLVKQLGEDEGGEND